MMLRKNNDVERVVKEKRRLWKAWQKDGSKEEYYAAKRRAKLLIYFRKMNAPVKKLSNLHISDNRNLIFKLSHELTGDNQDIAEEKYEKKDDCSIDFSEVDKLTAWKGYYNRLLNIEFP